MPAGMRAGACLAPVNGGQKHPRGRGTRDPRATPSAPDAAGKGPAPARTASSVQRAHRSSASQPRRGRRSRAPRRTSASSSSARPASTSCSIEVLNTRALARHGHAVSLRFVDGAADACADRRASASRRRRISPPARPRDPVRRCPGEGRDRVHRHVAPELVPDLARMRGRNLDLEAGASSALERGDATRADHSPAGSPTMSRAPMRCS